VADAGGESAGIPPEVLGLAGAIATGWIIRGHRLLAALLARARAERISLASVKVYAVKVGLCLAWGSRNEPQRIKRNSRRLVIPSQVFVGPAFAKWLRREAIKAARADLLNQPYPFTTPGDPKFEIGLDGEEIYELYFDYDPDVPKYGEPSVEDLYAEASPGQKAILDDLRRQAITGRPSIAETARAFGKKRTTVDTQVRRAEKKARRAADRRWKASALRHGG